MHSSAHATALLIDIRKHFSSTLGYRSNRLADSNPATERYSACREARRRYKIDISPTKTVDSTVATTEDTFEGMCIYSFANLNSNSE